MSKRLLGASVRAWRATTTRSAFERTMHPFVVASRLGEPLFLVGARPPEGLAARFDERHGDPVVGLVLAMIGGAVR